MKIKLNKLGFWKSLMVEIMTNSLAETLRQHEKGVSIVSEIKDDAYSCLTL